MATMAAILDLRRLRYFAAIAEHGSLSAAARALNVAQPALSHHVREMEAGFGVPLLVRHRDGVALTEAGRLLHRHARDVDASVRAAETEMSALAGENPPLANVRLAIIASIAADLTPALLALAARDLSGTVLRITEAATLDSYELLAAGKADIAVSLAARDDEPIARERLHLVGRSGEDGAIPLAEVVGRPLILPARRNPLREMMEAGAATIGVPLNVVLEIDGAAPRLNAVLAGLGCTILGAHSIAGAADWKRLSVRPISEPAMTRPLFLGVRPGLDAGLVRRIRALLAEALAGLGSLEMVPPAHSPDR